MDAGPAGAASLAGLLRQARERLAAGDAAGANEAALKARAIDPNSPSVRAAVAMARLAYGAGSADDWHDLGVASIELGRFGEAIRALTEAVSGGAGPGSVVELAMLHALRGEPVRAAAALRGVLEREPEHGDARLHLATLMMAEGREAEVLALLEGGGNAPPVRAARSFALLRLGRPDEARSLLWSDGERTLPVALQRLRLAVACGDGGAAGPLADDVARLAEDPRPGRPDLQVEAWFQLGALHDRARPDLAIGAWRRGHAILAAAQPFSRAHHAALIEAAMAAWGSERPVRGPAGDPTPVFIVGTPRSGTTLAEHILAAHPSVHGAGERLDVLQAAARLGGPVLDPDSSGRAARAGPAAWRAEGERVVAALRAGAGPGVRRVIDKMPANDMQLGLIAAMLPGARVIHCRRDPRAAGLSIYRRYLSGYHPYAHDLGDLGWWLGAQGRLMDHWRRVLPLPVLQLDLADWHRDFGATLRRVLDFVGLPYDAACERFHLQERTVVTASRDQVRRPVGKQSGEDWRRYEPWLAPLLTEL